MFSVIYQLIKLMLQKDAPHYPVLSHIACITLNNPGALVSSLKNKGIEDIRAHWKGRSMNCEGFCLLVKDPDYAVSSQLLFILQDSA